MEMLNLMPDYIGKGIMQLLVITLCGVIVAWITVDLVSPQLSISYTVIAPQGINPCSPDMII